MSEARPTIFAVDRNPRNLELLGQFLTQEGYQSVRASTMEQFQQAIDRANSLDLALVDISGFDRRIWDYCEQLSHQGVPLLIISPQSVAHIRQESLAHGAHGVIFKPIVIKELSTILRTMLRDRRRE